MCSLCSTVQWIFVKFAVWTMNVSTTLSKIKYQIVACSNLLVERSTQWAKAVYVKHEIYEYLPSFVSETLGSECLLSNEYIMYKVNTYNVLCCNLTAIQQGAQRLKSNRGYLDRMPKDNFLLYRFLWSQFIKVSLWKPIPKHNKQ